MEGNQVVSKPNLKNIDPYYGCHWYDNGMWFYAHVDHTGKWYVSISSPESGNFAESGYYKGTELTTDNEGTILKVGDEVAVIVKVGKAASIRRGKITKLSKSYAFVDVEDWPFQTKFAPQSVLKIARREQKEKLSVEDSHWYCNNFLNCETFDCINCAHKEKIENGCKNE